MPDSNSDSSSSPALDPASARVGAWLKEKWRLDRLIGIGGMASVYEATHRNGNRVAIKILHPQLSVNDEVRGRFLREGYVANRVEHVGAVSVLDDDVTDDGAHFLVMELLAGETLDAHMREHGPRLDALFVLSVMDQVLAVLASAHERGIVHRDIKPENIFLTEAGGVKVLDFGIARLRELATPGAANVGTQTGLAMGTPGFMPPEQARGRWDEVDARSDLWAVGATLFAALSGTQVHSAQTVNELLLAAMTQPAPSLQSVFPSATGQLSLLVDRALAFHKEQRFEDARQMQAQLREAQRSLGLDAPPLGVVKPPPVVAPVRLASSTAVTAQAPVQPPPSLPGVTPPSSFTPQPVSISDARAVLEQAGREALVSATTVHEARVTPPVQGGDASSGKRSSRGARKVAWAVVALGLLGGVGAMFAYPEAPVTMQIRSMLSPLLYRGAEAIAPESSAAPSAEPQPVAARAVSAPAETLPAEPAPAAATSASVEAPAPAATDEPAADDEDADEAPSADGASPASSASARQARPTPHVAGVMRNHHTGRATSKGAGAKNDRNAKAKPKWQAPASNNASKKKPKR